MGNQSSRDSLLTRELKVYDNHMLRTSYSITNSKSQIVSLGFNSKVKFRFINDDGLVYLKINYNGFHYRINKEQTYKEGDIQFIEICLHPQPNYNEDPSLINDVHLIKWHDTIKKVYFNFYPSVI